MPVDRLVRAVACSSACRKRAIRRDLGAAIRALVAARVEVARGVGRTAPDASDVEAFRAGWLSEPGPGVLERFRRDLGRALRRSEPPAGTLPAESPTPRSM